MSLLNQVLQDLEKRNTNNIPEEYEADILSHVKSISVRQYKSYYQIASLMLFTSIIVFTIYHFKPNQSAALIIAPQQKLTQALKPNNSAKYVQTLITEIPLKEDIKKTRQAAIKNQAV
ncbi:MAG: hypothetical protein KAT04_07830, partial [Methylococcales bacterium]|nr:hypothetical protein [Methylococcales bacterium]